MQTPVSICGHKRFLLTAFCLCLFSNKIIYVQCRKYEIFGSYKILRNKIVHQSTTHIYAIYVWVCIFLFCSKDLWMKWICKIPSYGSIPILLKNFGPHCQNSFTFSIFHVIIMLTHGIIYHLKKKKKLLVTVIIF